MRARVAHRNDGAVELAIEHDRLAANRAGDRIAVHLVVPARRHTTGCGHGFAVAASRPAMTICLSLAAVEFVQDLVARQHLRDRCVRLAAFADRGEELAILQLDAVHRHVHLRHVDLFFLAGDEVVIARDLGAVVADVAEERAERAVIVERQRERADRAASASSAGSTCPSRCRVRDGAGPRSRCAATISSPA